MKKVYWLIGLFGLLFVLGMTALAQDESAFPGRIAYVGADFNVYTRDFQAGADIQLTDDGGVQRQYQWPTWANDGRLAYFVTPVSAGGLPSSSVFISEDGNEPGNLVFTGTDSAFIYAYWSPQDCADGANCRDLAVLLQDLLANNLFVELVRAHDGGTSNQTAGTSANAFYYSWSPDGNQMLWTRGGREINLYDAENASLVSSLAERPGFFFAPSWSPVDSRWLVATLSSSGQATDLVVVSGDETHTLAPDLAGPVYFSWSPDGSKIAYTDQFGPLMVIDSQSGEVVTRSPVAGVIAFFWSPNSEHLAYVTLSAPPGSFNAGVQGPGVAAAPALQDGDGLAWSILDVADGAVRRYGAFIPTNPMFSFLRFFDQYAQSHRLWSPDSHYLVYGEVSSAGVPVVSVIDTTEAESLPFPVAEGFMGIWSFD